MKDDATAATGTLVRQGADAYAQALDSAGGKELEALMRGAERSAVCAAIYASPPYDLQVPPLGVARLSVNLTQARVSGGVQGERQRSYAAQRYSMFLVPAGMPMAWRKDAPSRHLNIYFHADLLADPAGFGERDPVFNVQVPGVRPFADQLAAELDCGGDMQAEAVDSLARLLLVRLARQWREPGAGANPVTPAVVARLREYIAAHLAERILVADMARVAGLPPNRFAQAFSVCTRQSPHQFVLALRLQRAALLLRGTRLTLVEVAHACGFANQQHLSNAMRRHAGTTPSRYRQAHAGE